MTKISRRTLAFSVVACLSLSTFLLALVFLTLMRPATAQAPQPDDVPNTVLTSLDPRWLQLVRGDAPKPGFGPEQAQSPQTLNVLLTDHSVAGAPATAARCSSPTRAASPSPPAPA
ncbi:MAG: hypothetical protein HC853_11785 [Anaerolineae bacterium]|nr:hypothetical protein [Anaerolineae bacterium]